MESWQNHAGVISFKKAASWEKIESAAKALAELPEFICVLVRRVDPLRWGIEFITRCNSDCQRTNISLEVDSWIKRITKKIPKEMIGGVNASGEVMLIKWTDPKGIILPSK